MLNLYLRHGRKDPAENLDDWGPDGATIKNVVGIHQTYGNGANVFFTDQAAAQEAKRLTGWEEWDGHALTMKWCADMVEVTKDGNTMFFGDWGLIAASPTN